MNCRNRKEIYEAEIKNKKKVIFLTSKVLLKVKMQFSARILTYLNT